MSELITRRTFLKATGAAALVAAAGSMLVGCGEGYGATPGNPTLPTIDTVLLLHWAAPMWIWGR